MKAEFLFRRALLSIGVIVGVTTLVFFMLRLLPGNPVDLILGEGAQKIDKENLTRSLGLDLSWSAQYLLFWRNILNGTLGQSLVYRRSAFSIIWERFPYTFVLAAASLVIATLLSVAFGVLGALFEKKILGSFLQFFSLLGMSLPIFVVGPYLIYLFSIRLGWLPVSGYESLKHFVLPIACLSFSLAGLLSRVLRASILETLSEDYIRTAKAKGLTFFRIYFLHALRNAFLPVFTVIGNQLGALLAGAVVTETIFDWPGIGKLFLKAFQMRDYPLIQAIVLWTAAVYVFLIFVIDLFYVFIDPRIEMEKTSLEPLS